VTGAAAKPQDGSESGRCCSQALAEAGLRELDDSAASLFRVSRYSAGAARRIGRGVDGSTIGSTSTSSQASPRRLISSRSILREDHAPPEPVSRDFAEEFAQPPAIKAKAHETGADVDEVRLRMASSWRRSDQAGAARPPFRIGRSSLFTYWRSAY
jgi:hypothetical protein